ncbi:AMP-binding protein, partial [Acinetobacter baumannii]|uniref:AMP-binding protein n=1 Tax=Acinetobacter baumannii TaxID=470 RepID=UPI0039174F83
MIINLGSQTVLIDDSTAAEARFAGNWISDVRSLTWSDNSKFLYVTSGSEGVPKAVQVGMDAVRNRITWMWNAYPYESSDLVVVQKPLSFVASFWEVLGTLLAGVTGVLITNIERS